MILKQLYRKRPILQIYPSVQNQCLICKNIFNSNSSIIQWQSRLDGVQAACAEWGKQGVLIKRNAGNIVLGKYFLLLEDLWVTKTCIGLRVLFYKYKPDRWPHPLAS